ncbi:MAG: DUF362 domain-containing protein [Candidatus Heimdallarchaeaceae archaeon]
MSKRPLVMTGEAVKNHVEGPVTLHVLKRLEKHPPPVDIRSFPIILEDRCILCGTCVKVCPTHCLEMDRENKDNGMIWILKPQCMMCGHCQTYCPKDAIFIDGTHDPEIKDRTNDTLTFSFDIHHEYAMLVAKGTYKEKVEEKMKELKELGDKRAEEREKFREAISS